MTLIYLLADSSVVSPKYRVVCFCYLRKRPELVLVDTNDDVVSTTTPVFRQVVYVIDEEPADVARTRDPNSYEFGVRPRISPDLPDLRLPSSVR